MENVEENAQRKIKDIRECEIRLSELRRFSLRGKVFSERRIMMTDIFIPKTQEESSFKRE